MRELSLFRGDEVGAVRIQFYDDHFRVGTFLPGRVADSPSAEPDRSTWCTSRKEADKVFERYVLDAYGEGWRRQTKC